MHQSEMDGVFFCLKSEGRCSMYPVSEAFLQAVQENTRRYEWYGRITTKAGVVHEFTQKDIVKGSGYITAQCCGSSEIELGTVYASEMGISLFSQIDRDVLYFTAQVLSGFFVINLRESWNFGSMAVHW